MAAASAHRSIQAEPIPKQRTSREQASLIAIVFVARMARSGSGHGMSSVPTTEEATTARSPSLPRSSDSFENEDDIFATLQRSERSKRLERRDLLVGDMKLGEQRSVVEKAFPDFSSAALTG